MAYPRFELVLLEAPEDLRPVVPEDLRSIYVPKALIGRSYLADADVKVISSGESHLLKFGSTGISGGICIDLKDRTIVEIQSTRSIAPEVVNDSLEHLTSCVRLVIDRFPFYALQDDYSTRSAVAEQLREIIRRVDTTATHPDGFWWTFIDDVAIGDYPLEEVTES